MSITEAASALRDGKISSVELTRQCLERIARLNPKLNAFLIVTEDQALEQGAAMDKERRRGVDRGPLHGIPIAHKDLFYTRGIRTTGGSRLFADLVPDYDAAVVERFHKAGAVLVGKTGLHELAYGITSSNPHFGFVRNPWDTNRIPGGSSGGSGSAVAAGLVFIATGSDTGGSIRIPASFCGVVGLKPTYGRVSRYGAMPLGFSLDHMGPLAGSVRDCALAMDAMAGYDPRDESCSRAPVPGNFLDTDDPSLKGLRIGLPENFFFDRLSAEVSAAIMQTCKLAEELGGRIVPIRVPDIEGLNTVARIILLAEASAVFDRHLSEGQKSRGMIGADVLALLDQGRLIAAVDYVNAQRLRKLIQHEFASIWNEVDCVFTPATPTPAPLIGQTTIQHQSGTEDTRLASTRLVRGINALGIPALAMPCGFNQEGLPLGLQILGPAFSEPLLFRVGAAIEDATGFHDRRPAGL